jgi:hypothetical protein
MASYNKFLYLHIKLLAKLKPQQLKSEVQKDFYPLDCMKDVDMQGEEEKKIYIQEAQAFIKLRDQIFTEGIRIFLSLLKPELIEKEYQEYGERKKQTKLTQAEILEEIITAVNKFKT